MKNVISWKINYQYYLIFLALFGIRNSLHENVKKSWIKRNRAKSVIYE